MAGQNDKNKKVKISEFTAGGNKIYEKTTPSKIYKSVTYKKGGPRTGESDFAGFTKSGPGKGRGYAGTQKVIDTKPNQTVDTIKIKDGPTYTSKSSTQAGNYKSDYKIVPNKKSGAGYSGD